VVEKILKGESSSFKSTIFFFGCVNQMKQSISHMSSYNNASSRVKNAPVKVEDVNTIEVPVLFNIHMYRCCVLIILCLSFIALIVIAVGIWKLENINS